MLYKSTFFRFLCILFIVFLPLFSYGQDYVEFAPTWSNNLYFPSGHPQQCGAFTHEFDVWLFVDDNEFIHFGDAVGIVPVTPNIEVSTDMITWHGVGSVIYFNTAAAYWEDGGPFYYQVVPMYYRYTAPNSAGDTDLAHIAFFNETLGSNSDIWLHNEGTLPLTATSTGPACAGGTVTLSTAFAPGGSYAWTGPGGFSSTAASPVRSSLSPAMAGNYYVTLTTPGGCNASSFATVTVGSGTPTGIYGNAVVCKDATTTLATPTGTGIWSSSNAAVATVSKYGAAVSGISGGTATITYNNGCGTATKTVSVTPTIAAIGGPSSVCVGSVMTLTHPEAGGVWISESSAAASVDPSSGTITGISAGIVRITYTIAGACGLSSVIKFITVNTLPATTNAVIGPATIVNNGNVNICSGQSVSLSSATTGGSWSSSNTAVATAGTSGIVTGVANGSALITYTAPVTCGIATGVVTVNVGVSAGVISGNTLACIGSTTALASSIGGGTWTSSDSTVAKVGYGTGRVTCMAAGTATITYSISTACGVYISTINVTVNATPAVGAITGAGTVCGTLTLANPTGDPAGTWSSSNSSIATVGATGVVAGVSPGTVNITFTAGSCSTSALVTVVPTSAGVITGTNGLCFSDRNYLTSSVPMGTWTSGTPAVAFMAPTSGTIVALTAGTTIITYTVANTCGSFSATATVTVSISPVLTSIVVCPGSTSFLASPVSGGLWTSGNTAVATVNGSTGAVSGVSPGVVKISYTTPSGCTSAKVVTVNTLPEVSLAGLPTVCPGSSNAVLLFSGSTGGTNRYDLEWGSAATAAGFIHMGDTATGHITSTLASFGWPADISDIIADTSGNVYITNATAGKIFKINVSGLFTEIAAGLNNPGGLAMDHDGNLFVTERYGHQVKKISPSGIVTTIAGVEGVNGYSGDGGPATAATLGYPFGIAVDALNNVYIADHNNNAIRKINASGVISTIAEIGQPQGVAIDLSGNLFVADFFNKIMKISSAGIVSTVAGTGASGFSGDGGPATAASLSYSTDVTVDKYGNLYIADADNSVIRKVTSSGIITSIAADASLYYPGTVAIDNSGNLFIADAYGISKVNNIYSSGFDGSAVNIPVAPTVAVGAYSATLTVSNLFCNATFPVTVTISDSSTSPVMNNTSMNAGSEMLLTHAVADGTWSSDNTSVATVGSGTGLVTGVAAGTANITYLAPTPCGTFSVTAVVTVNTVSAAGTITGPDAVCIGGTITLSDTVTGGTWSSSNTAIATVSTSGIVSGIAPGTVLISYSTATASVSKVVTVTSLPDAGTITGIATVCQGASVTLADAVTGGTWGSGNTAIATVSTSGVVTGIAPGTATISYAVTNSCGTYFATKMVTVNPTPGSGTITGTATVCVGNTTTLSNVASGGVWSSSDNLIAMVGSGSGVVTGVASGTATISYSVTNGCGTAVATKAVTVNPLPGVSAITGTGTVCSGATTALSNGVAGGTWASGSTSIATVNTSGVVTGVTAGTVTISYTVTNGCGAITATTVATVNALPVAGTITGASSVNAGATITLTGSVSGGTWSVSNSNATISATGLLSGVTIGSTVVSYTVTNGCGTAVATKAISIVTFSLGEITGTLTVCQGTMTTLSNATTGGSWNSSNFAVATVGAASGIVTGVTAGTARITYSYSGYSTSAVVTVTALPAAISGASSVCINASVALTDATSGGTWSSSNPALGTVSATGVVTGIAAGTPVISYILGTGCYRAVNITVKALPGGITGNTGLCVGATSTVTAGTGTSWSSSTPAVATIGVLSGVVTGVSAGTSTITFNASTGCIATRVVTVAAAPTIAAITGPSGVLIGGTITMGDATPGGVWSSNSTARATVSAVGVVTGISAPAATISYTVTNDVCVKSVTKLITVTSHRPGGNDGSESYTSIRVYPNPTTGVFTVKSPVGGVFTVYTVDGRVVQAMNVLAGTNTFNLQQELAAGVYMCRFNGEDGSSAMVRLVYE